MKRVKAAIAGALSLAIAGGGLMLAATSASAVTPAFEPDPNSSNGSITFYDSSGNVITGGSNLNHMFDYAVASSPASRTGITKATIYFAFPDHTKSDSTTWFSAQATAASTFPIVSAPAPINASTNPAAAAASSEANLQALLGTTTLDTTAGYANILQIRLKDSGAGVGKGILASPFWSTDISFDSVAGTWTQVYPAPAVAIGTSTALTVTPASPATAGANVTLTANVSAASGPTPSTGTVKFFDGASQIGSTQSWTGSAVSVSTTSLVVGSHSLTAQYLPGAGFTGSTSPVNTYVINGAVTPTNTVLAVNTGSGAAFSPVQFTATVTPSGAPGTVTFTEGTTVLGSVTGAGSFVLTTSTLPQGSHTITATFAPTDPTSFGGSNNTAAAFSLTAPLYAPDAQTIDVVVDPGTLTITTPYTPTNPFHLGSMVLDANGTKLSASKQFGSITDGSNGVTVTDTRAGDLPWTVSASSTDFVKGTDLINGHNFGFTAIKADYLSGNALNAGTKPVTTTDVPADSAIHAPADNSGTAGLKSSHAIANAAHGVGTVRLDGLLSLNAPTSTVAGTYTATLTFTIA